MLKAGDTQLNHIRRHTLWLECACGHTGPVEVRQLLGIRGLDTVADVVERARCRACGIRQINGLRIAYAGGSAVALHGAEQGVAEPSENPRQAQRVGLPDR
jgi:hypothetical protein